MGPSFTLVFDFDGGGAFDEVHRTESPIASKGLVTAGAAACLAAAEAMVVCTCASLLMPSFERVVLDGAAGVDGGGADEEDEDDPP